MCTVCESGNVATCHIPSVFAFACIALACLGPCPRKTKQLFKELERPSLGHPAGRSVFRFRPSQPPNSSQLFSKAQAPSFRRQAPGCAVTCPALPSVRCPRSGARAKERPVRSHAAGAWRRLPGRKILSHVFTFGRLAFTAWPQIRTAPWPVPQARKASGPQGSGVAQWDERAGGSSVLCPPRGQRSLTCLLSHPSHCVGHPRALGSRCFLSLRGGPRRRPSLRPRRECEPAESESVRENLSSGQVSLTTGVPRTLTTRIPRRPCVGLTPTAAEPTAGGASGFGRRRSATCTVEIGRHTRRSSGLTSRRPRSIASAVKPIRSVKARPRLASGGRRKVPLASQ